MSDKLDDDDDKNGAALNFSTHSFRCWNDNLFLDILGLQRKMPYFAQRIDDVEPWHQRGLPHLAFVGMNNIMKESRKKKGRRKQSFS